MRRLPAALAAVIVLPLVLWLMAEPGAFQASGFFAIRGDAVQITGILAMSCMSVAMILAARPRAPEGWLGGLDKMYRLHKWLGIGALVLGIVHWLWAKGTKYAVGWGLLDRPQRGPRPEITDPFLSALASLRGPAETVGEWAFYGAVLLIGAALIKWFPYRSVFKTHKILAVIYLALVLHAVVLAKPAYWASPLGVVLALVMAAGVVSGVLILTGRVAAWRRVRGRVADVAWHPGVRVLQATIDVPEGWRGHRAGQFAFLTVDRSEGAHPFTIASAWNPADPRLTFLVKELGDHTATLKDRLRPGLDVTVEGPYGRFTFDDDRPRQIWVGGGIGITPFVARMKQLAQQDRRPRQRIDLFHTTADVDEAALTKLKADAEAAGVRLHILVDSRDGLLDARRIRAAVPDWREASIWFCGPSGFGHALRRDLLSRAGAGSVRFHQELFAMR